MDRTKILCVLSLLALAGGCSSRAAIRVGSKNFTEQVVLGEIIAQHLEHRLHAPVERKLNLGGTLLAHGALVNREIDLYPEYTGTALAAVLKAPIQTDPAAVFELVRSEYARKFQLDWLTPLGIDDTFAMVIRGPDARARNLSSLSEAAAQSGWTLGVGYEFEQRQDGLAALGKTYGFKWAGAPKTMDLGLLYEALAEGQVNMIAANSTDGLLSKMDLRILQDDRHAFPPYQVAIVARQDSLRDHAGMREALLELSGKFTNEKMQQLNYRVDGEHQSVKQVAADFLKQAGLE